MKVYLAGYISGSKIKECIEWRKKVREYYDNWKGERYPIEWLDPLNGEIEKISPDGLDCSLPGKALVHRDFCSVKVADLIIANLDTFGEPRPSVGTTYELAWAWYLKKPVVMITTDDNYINHPFVKDTVSKFVKDVDELLESKIVNYFFKGQVTANY